MVELVEAQMEEMVRLLRLRKQQKVVLKLLGVKVVRILQKMVPLVHLD